MNLKGKGVVLDNSSGLEKEWGDHSSRKLEVGRVNIGLIKRWELVATERARFKTVRIKQKASGRSKKGAMFCFLL